MSVINNRTLYGGGIMDTGKHITLSIVKNTINVLDSFAPMLQQILLGDMADKPWEDVAPEIIKTLQKNSALMKHIMTDPEMQAVTKELFQTFAMIIIQILKVLQPQIDEITDQMWNSISEVASRSAVGFVNTVLNVIMSAIGEIPIAGGIVELIVSILRGINHTLQAAAPAIEFGISAFGTSFFTGVRFAEIIGQGSVQILDVVGKFTKAIESFSNIGGMVHDKINAVDNKITEVQDNATGENTLNGKDVSFSEKDEPIKKDSTVRDLADDGKINFNNTLNGNNVVFKEKPSTTGGGKSVYKKKIRATKKRIVKRLNRFNNTRKFPN